MCKLLELPTFFVGPAAIAAAAALPVQNSQFGQLAAKRRQVGVRGVGSVASTRGGNLQPV